MSVPVVTWCGDFFCDIRLHHLQGDVVAGITVGLTVIPQSIAYAQIAGLSAQVNHSSLLLYIDLFPATPARLLTRGGSISLAFRGYCVTFLWTAVCLRQVIRLCFSTNRQLLLNGFANFQIDSLMRYLLTVKFARPCLAEQCSGIRRWVLSV